MTGKIAFIIAMALMPLFFSWSSCKKKVVKGCADKLALNFSEEAQEDDGTCTYPRDNFTGNYQGIKNCLTTGVDSFYNFRIVKSASNRYEINLLDFPESAGVTKARIDDQNLSRFVIPSQDLVNGLDSFSISGEATLLNNQLILNFYRISANNIDTCYLNAFK
jgi:hypothetical protein